MQKKKTILELNIESINDDDDYNWPYDLIDHIDRYINTCREPEIYIMKHLSQYITTKTGYTIFQILLLLISFKSCVNKI